MQAQHPARIVEQHLPRRGQVQAAATSNKPVPHKIVKKGGAERMAGRASLGGRPCIRLYKALYARPYYVRLYDAL